MRRVFVDVDDTLVLFTEGTGTHHYGVLYGEPFEPNRALIDKLVAFDGEIIIWSGGGAEYAKQVAEMVLPKGIGYATADKSGFRERLKAGDIVVDDDRRIRDLIGTLGISFFGPLDDWR